MIRITIAMGCALILLACASAGRRVDTTHLGDIRNGAQSKAEIRAWFGEPYRMTSGLTGHPNGCVERWTWEYAEAQGFGTVTFNEVLIVDFDSAGRVCDHGYSKTGEG